MSRFLRYLRIVFSTICLIACVMFSVLWVRSYWQFDLMLVRLSPKNDLRIVTCRGKAASCISSPSVSMVTGEFRISPNAWMNSKVSWWISSTIESGLGDDLQRNFTPNLVRTNLGGADGRIVIIPLWIVIASSGSFAVAPWIHWSNQFNLRTLLLATTLIAVVLGLVMWSLR